MVCAMLSEENDLATGSVYRHYRGWIPTVSGYLSLSVFGDVSKSARTTCINLSDGHDRFIVCHQHRKMSDALLPWLSVRQSIRRNDGSIGLCRREALHFVVLAHCPKHGAEQRRGKMLTRDLGNRPLYGQVLVYDEMDWPLAEPKLRAMREALIEADKVGKSLRAPLLATSKKWQTRPPQIRALGMADFVVRRNGIISIKLRKAGTDYIRIESGADELASQMYYFLRDMLHRHQHHNQSAILLSRIHHVRDYYNIYLSINCDLLWMSRVYRSIMNRVITLRRDRDEVFLERSLGMMAYAESFLDISKKYINGKISQYSKSLSEKSPETHLLVSTEAGQTQDDGVFPTFRTDNKDKLFEDKIRKINSSFMVFEYNTKTLRSSIESKIKSTSILFKKNDDAFRKIISVVAIILSILAINISIFANLFNKLGGDVYGLNFLGLNFFKSKIYVDIYHLISNNILQSNAFIIATIILFIGNSTIMRDDVALYEEICAATLTSLGPYKRIFTSILWVSLWISLAFATFWLPPIKI